MGYPAAAAGCATTDGNHASAQGGAACGGGASGCVHFLCTSLSHVSRVMLTSDGVSLAAQERVEREGSADAVTREGAAAAAARAVAVALVEGDVEEEAAAVVAAAVEVAAVAAAAVEEARAERRLSSSCTGLPSSLVFVSLSMHHL